MRGGGAEGLPGAELCCVRPGCCLMPAVLPGRPLQHRLTPLPRSKQIHFGVMPPAEIFNTAELHVYERALYKVGRGWVEG